MLGAVLLFACTAPEHAQVQQPQFTATIQSSFTVVPSSVPLLEGLHLDPTPSPEPTLALAPAAPPSARAAEADTPAPLPPPPPPPLPRQTTEGVPWFVPPEWHERYLACLDAPYRHTVPEMVWQISLDGGFEGGWSYADAIFVVEHEGGNDYCQFNTQGSGACGPFQLLTCPPDGLTPEGQRNGAFAKWKDGGGSFQRHWFNFWGR